MVLRKVRNPRPTWENMVNAVTLFQKLLSVIRRVALFIICIIVQQSSPPAFDASVDAAGRTLLRSNPDYWSEIHGWITLTCMFLVEGGDQRTRRERETMQTSQKKARTVWNQTQNLLTLRQESNSATVPPVMVSNYNSLIKSTCLCTCPVNLWVIQRSHGRKSNSHMGSK